MQTPGMRRTAANVRAELARSGVSQREVCARLHLSRTAVSNRLQGHVDFRMQELRSIAELLETTVGALVDDIDVVDTPNHSPSPACSGRKAAS